MDKTEQDIETLPEFYWLRGEHRKLWYTTAEIAAGIGLSQATIVRRCEAGQFPGARYYKDAGWKVPYSGIVEYLRHESRRAGDQAQ